MSKAVKAAHEFVDALREQLDASREHAESLHRYADTNRFIAREARKIAKGPARKDVHDVAEAALKKADALSEFAEAVRENNSAITERIEATQGYVEALREFIEMTGVSEKDLRDMVKRHRDDIEATRKTITSIREETGKQDEASRTERGYAEQLPEIVRQNRKALSVLAKGFRKETRVLNELVETTRETADDLRGDTDQVRKIAGTIRKNAGRFARGADAETFDGDEIFRESLENAGKSTSGAPAGAFDASEVARAMHESADAYTEMSKATHEHLESLLRYAEVDRLASDAARKIADALPEKEVQAFARDLLNKSEKTGEYIEVTRALYEALCERSKIMHEYGDALNEYEGVVHEDKSGAWMRATVEAARVAVGKILDDVKEQDEATRFQRKYAEMLRDVAKTAHNLKLSKEERKRYLRGAKNAREYVRKLNKDIKETIRTSRNLSQESEGIRRIVKMLRDNIR